MGGRCVMVRTKMASKWTLALGERVYDVTWIGMMIFIQVQMVAGVLL
jgi:hypothetical protein